MIGVMVSDEDRFERVKWDPGRLSPAATPGYWRRHVHKESVRNTGSPMAWSAMTNRTPARDRSGALGWRRGSQYRGSRVTPVEGRDLSSRQTQQVVRDLEIGQPINSENCSETAEGVARESEAEAGYRFYAL